MDRKSSDLQWQGHRRTLDSKILEYLIRQIDDGAFDRERFFRQAARDPTRIFKALSFEVQTHCKLSVTPDLHLLTTSSPSRGVRSKRKSDSAGTIHVTQAGGIREWM
jgi:hypothetical protein